MTTESHPTRLMRWIKTALFAALFSLALILSPQAFALDKINTTFFGNLAIEGYDPVAYFTQNQAVEGSKQHQLEWMDASWRFSNAENLARFKADPQKYAPQYGGYCAYAISQNTDAGIDPEQFTLHEGKLYLNYNRSINKKWLKDKEQYIIDADRYWPQLTAE